MTRRRTALSVLGVGLACSQAGHLLAFQMRFGAAAQHLQSSGAHGYFPLVAKTTLGVAAAVFLAGIFVIGLARVLAGRSLLQRGPESPYVRLLAALFTIQLGCFIAQEVAEATVAGLAVDSAAHLLLWGTLGQLPVAAVAALALSWLWKRLESAIDDLRAVLATVQLRWPPVPAAIALQRAPDRTLLLSAAAGNSLAKRAPPSSSLFSA